MSTSNQVAQLAQVAKVAAAAAAAASTTSTITSEDVMKQNEDLARQIELTEFEIANLLKVLERMKVQQDLKEQLAELSREKEEILQQIEAVQSGNPGKPGKPGKPRPGDADYRPIGLDARVPAPAPARDASTAAYWARRCYEKARLEEF